MGATALGVTLAACLVYSAAREDRHYVRYAPEAGLAQRSVRSSALPSAAAVNRMSAQLAARELQKDLIAEGTKHVSPKARHALSSLVAAPTSKLQEVDCARLPARTTRPRAACCHAVRGDRLGAPAGHVCEKAQACERARRGT
jgi:hypothetical protein